MAQSDTGFQKPPAICNEDGNERTIGLELEFSGLKLDEITGAIMKVYGGEVEKTSNYEAKVKKTRFGDFRVELDAELFREMKVRNYFKKIGLDTLETGLGDSIEEFMATAAEKVVPFEIVFPPVPITAIPDMDDLRNEIYETGAKGTGASFFYAFGLHLNPELPSTGPGTVLAYLKSFLILYESLKAELDIDLSREITPFIDPFPDSYIIKILKPGYHPETPELIEDYIEYNPTRNRPLDMLPMLAWMDEDRVRNALPGQKISRRPTLHYRLPNSRIDEPGWNFTLEWNKWMPVENLASDPEKLDSMARKYLYHLEHPLLSRAKTWMEEIRDVFTPE
ncbi:MAG: amidoligase [Balneolaceae bacterium]|nr:MAG: amidoligase [Balneolaceae bacterium]